MNTGDNFPRLTQSCLATFNTLGANQKRLVQRMGSGGSSNKAGATYESHFAVQLVLDWTKNSTEVCGSEAEYKLAQVMLTNGEAGAVEDWCLMVDKGDNCFYKENYQLKNSPTTGRWCDDLGYRFSTQNIIDTEFSPIVKFRHILVCSDEKVVSNNQKVLKDIDMRWTSRYFPYFPSLTDRVSEDTSFRGLLSEFVDSDSNLEPAARILCSVFSADSSVRKNLQEVWADAKSLAKPDIFSRFPDSEVADLPQLSSEFIEKCEALGIRIDGNHVLYRGMKLRFSDNLPVEIARKGVDHLSTPEDVISFVMGVSSVQGEGI